MELKVDSVTGALSLLEHATNRNKSIMFSTTKSVHGKIAVISLGFKNTDKGNITHYAS